MNEDVKKKWVEALRSGKYVQGKGALRCEESQEGPKHCCLGVLCELAVDAGVTMRYSRYDEDDPFVGFGPADTDLSVVEKYCAPEGFSEDFLPAVVQKWAGLTEEDPIVEKEDGATLSYFNDRGNYTFEQIAKVIEENL